MYIYIYYIVYVYVYIYIYILICLLYMFYKSKLQYINVLNVNTVSTWGHAEHEKPAQMYTQTQTLAISNNDVKTYTHDGPTNQQARRQKPGKS